MSNVTKVYWDDVGRLILRVAVGGMMLLHGISKMQSGVGKLGEMLRGRGLPEFVAYGVYVGEVIAPVMILAGFCTRSAAAIVGFNMIVAIGLAHSGDIFKLSGHGGWAIELPMFYLLGSAALMCLGGGKYVVCSGRCARL
jgi:putative oxidoreductase